MVAHYSRNCGEVDLNTVTAAVKLLQLKTPVSEIARTLGIHRSTVHRIKNGEHASQQRAPVTRRCRCGLLVMGECLACAIDPKRVAG